MKSTRITSGRDGISREQAYCLDLIERRVNGSLKWRKLTNRFEMLAEDDPAMVMPAMLGGLLKARLPDRLCPVESLLPSPE
jgi:hypothetical protein